MTDATKTADILAAWQLIEEHDLDVGQSIFGGYVVCDRYSPDPHGSGLTRIAAVRAWAESAGVPWPVVKVVKAFASFDEDGFLWDANHDRECVAGEEETVVPCEVVIRESEGV